MLHACSQRFDVTKNLDNFSANKASFHKFAASSGHHSSGKESLFLEI